MPSGQCIAAGWQMVRGMPVMLAFLALPVAAETIMDVRIEHYQFVPAEVQVRVGDSVRWVNHEKRTSHSLVFPEEGGRESDRLFPEESWQRRFEQAGRYPYRCGPHPEMQGVIVVTE